MEVRAEWPSGRVEHVDVCEDAFSDDTGVYPAEVAIEACVLATGDSPVDTELYDTEDLGNRLIRYDVHCIVNGDGDWISCQFVTEIPLGAHAYHSRMMRGKSCR